MIRLESITVNGYKNVVVQNLSLENFNVFVGPNNSGKTNFFEIISFINFIINGPIDSVEESFSQKYFASGFSLIKPDSDRNDKGLIEFLLTFTESEVNQIYNYFLSLKWLVMAEESYPDLTYQIVEESLNFKKKQTTGKATSIFHRKESVVSYGVQLSKTSAINKLPYHVSVLRVLKIIPEKSGNNTFYRNAIDSLNQILKSPTFFFSNFELLKTGDPKRTEKYGFRTISFDLENEIVSIMGTPKCDLLKDALNLILKISEIDFYKFPKSIDTSKDAKKETTEYEYYVFFRHFNKIKGIEEFSDGSIMIIALLTKILTSKSSILFIEEPENSLHPQALIDLISFIRGFEDEKQFFINTHSIALINKINPEDVIIAECNKKGISEFTRVTDIKEMRKKLKQSFLSFSDELFFNPVDD